MRKHFVMQTNTNILASVSTNSIQSICKLSFDANRCIYTFIYIYIIYIYAHICDSAGVTIYSCSRALVVGSISYICVFMHFQPFMCMFVCCMRLLVTCGICSRHIASVRFVTFSLFCRCAFFFFQLTVSKLCNAFEKFFAPTPLPYKHKYSIFSMPTIFSMHAFRRLSIRYIAVCYKKKLPQYTYLFSPIKMHRNV